MEIMTVKEVADFLRLKEATVCRLASEAGRFPLQGAGNRHFRNLKGAKKRTGKSRKKA